MRFIPVLKRQLFICKRLAEAPPTVGDGTLQTSTIAENWFRELSLFDKIYQSHTKHNPVIPGVFFYL